MVIRDIQKEDGSFKLLVEEQIHKNLLYRIVDCYSPAMDVDNKGISISYINENDPKKYLEEYRISIYEETVEVAYLIHDKNRSTNFSDFSTDNAHFGEIIKKFESLINSGLSEFTPKALKIYEEVKTYEHVNKIGVMKNAV